jgi:hypothetical protein
MRFWQLNKFSTIVFLLTFSPVLRAEEIVPPLQAARGLAAITAPDLPGPTLESLVSRFKFGAFADLRYTRVTAHNDPNMPYANAESGFGLEDGALYGNYDDGKLAVVLDLAFRRAKDFDTNPGATVKNQSSNANFGIGVDKSQLYVKYRVNDFLLVDFGQFDTVFGVELNDSKDRFFGKTGLVFDSSLPNTHTGLILESLWRGFYAKAFVVNPAGRGSLGTSSSGDERVEVGGALGYSDETIHGQLGAMRRSLRNPAGVASSRELLEATVGASFGGLAVDFEADRLDDGGKNTLTSGNLGDREKAGLGFMALATYKINEPWSVGVRWEELRNDPGAAGVASSSGKSAGVHYRVAPSMELRSEYIDYRFKNDGASRWKGSRFNFATVLSF